MRQSSTARRRGAVLAAAGAFAVVAPSALLLAAGPASADPVTSGDVVVYRVGDGSTTLSSSASQVSLQELTPAGSSVQTLTVPVTGSGTQHALTASGTATSEGALSGSVDGSTLYFTGYDAPLGTATIASSTAPRVVGRLTSDGRVDTSTEVTSSSFTGNNVRSAVEGDTAGAVTVVGGKGTVTTAAGTVAPGTVINAQNSRVVEHLTPTLSVISTGSGTTYRIAMLNTSTGTLTQLPGVAATGSPYAFAAIDAMPGVGFNGTALDTLYVTDDTAGTITKYGYNATTSAFAAAGTISVASVRGLVAAGSASGATLYATTDTSTVSTVVKVTDPAPAAPTTAGATTAVIATAPASFVYRGIAFTPTAAAAKPPTSLPEAPYALLIPLVAAGVFGAVVVRRRA